MAQGSQKRSKSARGRTAGVEFRTHMRKRRSEAWGAEAEEGAGAKGSSHLRCRRSGGLSAGARPCVWGEFRKSGDVVTEAMPHVRLLFRRCENIVWQINLRTGLGSFSPHFSLGWAILDSFKEGFSSSMSR